MELQRYYSEQSYRVQRLANLSSPGLGRECFQIAAVEYMRLAERRGPTDPELAHLASTPSRLTSQEIAAQAAILLGGGVRSNLRRAGC